MEILSIEEKVQRYDQAIKVAKSKIKNDKNHVLYEDDVIEIFPELNESDDEKIRKEILDCFRAMKQQGCFPSKHKEQYDSWIDWLEKQSEQKPQGKSALEVINEENADNQFCVKPVNKVKPKFKVGDWIIGRATSNEPRQISEITDQCYKSTYGGQYGFSFEDELHLWTIKDAKDGDILVSKDSNSILIFRHLSLDDDDTFSSYYSIIFSSYYNMQGYDEHGWLNTNFVPATKEQRDLLFQKMTEAGYEWDVEKKELKKINDEIEIPYGAKDSELQEDIYYIPKGFHAEIDKDKVFIKKGEKPTAWSEEDEKKRNLLIDILNVNHPNGRFKVNPANTLNMETMSTEELVDWLKSLRPQNTWKPNDAQMIALNDVITNGHLSNANERIFSGLQEQLKKLKGE